MSQSLTIQEPMYPLKPGDVVTAAVLLYRSRLRSYLGISVMAHLWALAFVIALIIGFSGFGAILGGLIGGNFFLLLIGLLFGVAGTWVAAYCMGQFTLNDGLISRLAFLDLVNQPEAVAVARQHLQTRLWDFFWSKFFITLLMLGVVFFAMLLLLLIFAAIGWLIQPVATNIAVGLIVSLFVVGLMVLWLLGITWCYTRWMVAEVPIALEAGVNGGDSVARSWDLSTGLGFRMILVASVAFLVTIPILSVTNVVPTILMRQMDQRSAAFWIVYGISLVISLVISALLQPFWQTTKAVLYYDLRSRREGLGLALRERS